MTPARVALVAVLSLLVLGSGWFAWQKLRPPMVIGATGTSGTVEIGGPFALTDHTGERRSDADFRGRYMLVFFGFTYCPDVCPTSLLTISRGLQMLGEREPELADQVVPLFVTVDPERDSVEAMAAYIAHFHPNIVGLTGTAEEIAAAAKAYRVYYAKAEDEASGTYLMDHSSFIYLMGPDGLYRTHFSHMTKAEEIADGLERHVGS